tara:strand:- start:1786 stop:2787 length:1002 start_codon:yes stop_codon:yes gene_type:complete
MIDIKEIYNKLLIHHSGGVRDYFLVEKININNQLLRVGLSLEGNPAFLIEGKEEDFYTEPTKALTGIKVEFGKECIVSNNDDEDKNSGIFNIISCTEEDLNLRNFFFSFFTKYFLNAKDIDANNLKIEINNLSKLFSYKKKKPLKSMMGLWSELYIIAHSENAGIWAQKWHDQAQSTFDFTFSRIGIDVKSFGGNRREHFFKLEQLTNSTVEQTLILSMCLNENEEGPNVFDLWSDIKEKLQSDQLIEKIERQIFKLAGKDIADAKRFNLEVAKQTLLILKGSEVPCLNPENTPLGISDIKFKSDCSAISGLDFNEVNQNIITSNSIIYSDIK